MFIFWRGFGWAVPVIAFLSLLLVQMSLNEIFGDGYYEANEWTKTAAIITGAVLIGVLGYIVNYRKRTVVIDEGTSVKTKSASHTLFFIPIEFWAVIVPVLFFWAQSVSEEREEKHLSYIESPAVNDLYSVDYTKIYEESDKEFKFGVMKVTSISPVGVEVLLSEIVYDKKSGVRKDIRKKATNKADYFSKDPANFTKDELLSLLNSDAIFTISRD